jgi:hypothetical protein
LFFSFSKSPSTISILFLWFHYFPTSFFFLFSSAFLSSRPANSLVPSLFSSLKKC